MTKQNRTTTNGNRKTQQCTKLLTCEVFVNKLNQMKLKHGLGAF